MKAMLDVAFPVFAVMAAGWLCGQMRLLGEASSEALNRFVYYVALPPFLFLGMVRAPLAEVLSPSFLAVYLGGVAGVFAFAFAVAAFAFPGRFACLSLHATGSVFSNTGYMGIPLILTAFGQAGAPPAILATVVTATVIVGGAIALVEADVAKAEGALARVRDVTLAVIRSPLVIAPAAGIAVNFFGLALPAAVETFCALVGAAASPCALFAIGLFMVGKPVAGNLKEVAWVCALKLVVHPAVTWLLAYKVLAVEPLAAKCAVILAALPIGSTHFVLAQKYGVYVRRSTAVVLLSTVLSAVTVSALLVALGVD